MLAINALQGGFCQVSLPNAARDYPVSSFVRAAFCRPKLAAQKQNLDLPQQLLRLGDAGLRADLEGLQEH